MPYDQQYDPYGGYEQQGGYYPPQQQYWPQQGGGGGWDPYAQQGGYPQQAWPQQGYDPYGQWQQGYYPQPQAPPEEPGAYEEQAEAPAQPVPGKKGKRKKEMDPKAQKALHAVLNGVYWVFMVTIILGAVLFASSKDPRKNYFGFRTYNVLTKSMMVTTYEDGTTSPKGLGAQGGFDPGDTIIIKMVPADQIQVGDIITYNPSSRNRDGTTYLTHRVVEVLDELSGQEGLWFVTKGDHNPDEDPPVPEDMYIGRKVAHIPKVGKLLTMVKDHLVLALMMFVSFFGCIFLLRWFFSKPKPKEGPAPQKT